MCCFSSRVLFLTFTDASTSMLSLTVIRSTMQYGHSSRFKEINLPQE